VLILKKLVADHGVDKYVEFFEWMPLKELLIRVSQSDLALIPHIKSPHTDSTIPHKLFQYMYAGIPILASDCDPLKRIITETSTGICFRDQDEQDFASKLFSLFNDTYFRDLIPESGKKWVDTKYNWNQDADRLVGLYSSI